MGNAEYDNLEWTPVLTQPQARRLAKARMMSAPKSVTLRWPNEIGEKPEDALGKMVRLSEGAATRYYEVLAIEGEKLILGRASI